jgi:hypothetical protein
MKKILFVVFATIIGSSTFASNSNLKLPARNKAVKVNLKPYPVTSPCPCGGTVTISSSCNGSVSECQAGWIAAINAACGD